MAIIRGSCCHCHPPHANITCDCLHNKGKNPCHLWRFHISHVSCIFKSKLQI
jgi:hypothetical protein